MRRNKRKGREEGGSDSLFPETPREPGERTTRCNDKGKLSKTSHGENDDDRDSDDINRKPGMNKD